MWQTTDIRRFRGPLILRDTSQRIPPIILAMDVTTTEVAIVGAGPIGLEMAVALNRRGIDYLHFDARQIGYTISWFAPQTHFFSSNERIAIAGVPLQTPDQSKATREQYLAYLRSVVTQFDLQVRTYEPVIGIDRGDDEFVITTNPASGQRQCRAKRVILATGGTDRPRRLQVQGEDLPHVSHYFRDPHEYFRKRVLIVGGKNSAVEAALRCHHAGAHVLLSYRRSELDPRSIKYWLTPEIMSLMHSGRIEGHLGTLPVKIAKSEVVLETVGRETKRQTTITVDFVLLLIGYEADVSLLKLAGVELLGECQAPQYDPQTMETNVPGLYVAGTATGGTQDKYALFIENCHVHVERILAALTGTAPPQAPAPLDRPES
jgi:thioredoxin reductase (NADPH)